MEPPHHPTPRHGLLHHLSSLGGVIANGGQSNYAAGNTFQDALAQHRCLHGEKATSLDLGIFLSDGVVADNDHIMKHLLRKGVFRPLEPDQLFALLDYYCDPRRGIPAKEEAQVVFGVYTPADSIARGIEIPNVMLVPLIRQMHQIDSSSTTTTTSPSSSSSSSATSPQQPLDTIHLFQSARTLSLATTIVAEALKAKLSKILGIPEAEIEVQHRVESYGVDSLVAVELRNWLGRELGAEVAVFEIVGGATLEGVGGVVARRSVLRGGEW